MGAFFKDKSELFIGMYVMHPETYVPAQVYEIDTTGSCKIRGAGSLRWGRSVLYPVSITPNKLSSFGFGTFGDGDRTFYHEENKKDPDHYFYGEYSLNDKELIINAPGGVNIIREGVKYVHEFQWALIEAGFRRLAVDTVVSYTGSTRILVT
jgi:hypothetical protein